MDHDYIVDQSVEEANEVPEGRQSKLVLQGNKVAQHFVQNVFTYFRERHPQLSALQVTGQMDETPIQSSPILGAHMSDKVNVKPAASFDGTEMSGNKSKKLDVGQLHKENCINTPLIIGDEETPVLKYIPPPELHLLLGVVQKLFDCIELENPNVATEWIRKAGLKLDHYGKFNGNNARQLLKKVDILQSISADNVSTSLSQGGPESRQKDIDEMIALKSKNKMERRIKAAKLKSTLDQPAQAETVSIATNKNKANTKTEPQQPGLAAKIVTIFTPSLDNTLGVRQREVDKMITLKEKNKVARRIKSEDMKNMPTQSVKVEIGNVVKNKGNANNKIDSPQPGLASKTGMISTPSPENTLEARQREVDKVVALNDKNKTVAANVKNVFSQPVQAEAGNIVESKSNANNKKNPEPSLEVKTDPYSKISLERLKQCSRSLKDSNPLDKEQASRKSIKQLRFILKPENKNMSSKNKNKINAKLTKTPKSTQDPRIRKTYCKKVILPTQKPTLIMDDLLEPYESTLDKPLGDKIKRVPKAILEIEEKAKKSSSLKFSDPLAKYRHLKITYMTVTRPAKKEDEKFLPSICRNSEKADVSEEENKKIINFRYELLKRLDEEFRKQFIQQLSTPNSAGIPGTKKTHPKIDRFKLQNVKTETEKDDMNTAKILEVIKPAIKGSLDSGLANIKRPKTSRKNHTGRKDGTKHGFEPSKGDGGDNQGPGGVRRFSTDSDKCGGTDSKDGKHEKADKCDETREPTVEHASDECKPASPTDINEVPESAKNFEITDAVPHAFECASPRLEEERQKELYYRYHQMSFLDLHSHLAEQRVFTIDAAEKKKQEECQKQEEYQKQKECQNRESSDCPDCKPTNVNECEKSDKSKP